MASVVLVKVLPKMAFDCVCSHHLIITSNGFSEPFAASSNSMAIAEGMTPAALWPMPATARQSVAFSSGLALLGYLPMRSGRP